MRKVGYTLSCPRPAYLLNRLIKAEVSVDGIKCEGGALLFWVDFRQSRVVDALLDAEGIDYRKKGYLGARASLHRALARPFLLVSVVIAITLVIVSGNFVYGYTISGNAIVNTSVVEAVLYEHGVRGIVSKRRIDTAAIKSAVGAIDGVSFASVKLEGGRLLVEIKEELPHEDPDLPRYDPVTSLYSAVVTRIVAESGSPVVKAGEKVGAGATLISPTYTFTEGEAPSPARGEVWGIVTYEKEVILPLYTMESVLTGEDYRARTVSVFGRTIGGERLPSFTEYDLEERDVYRGVGVTVRERIYHRRTFVTLYHDFDAEAPRLAAEATAELLLSVPFYARERGRVEVVQKKLDNVLYIVLYYSVEQRIDSLFVAP